MNECLKFNEFRNEFKGFSDLFILISNNDMLLRNKYSKSRINDKTMDYSISEYHRLINATVVSTSSKIDMIIDDIPNHKSILIN